MNLSTYVENLRHELAVAAGAGGEETRALAERLSAPLESAARLALLEALSAAADEITTDLAPGSVEVRLRGRDPQFIVTPPPADEPVEEVAPPAPSSLKNALVSSIEVAMGVRPPAESGQTEEESGGTSRITLRLPEHLKPHIDDAAGQAGLSVNAWLVRVIAAALTPGDPGRTSGRSGSPVGRRYTGWVR
ncbi:MAG TPA: hypothetical protein VH912_04970 [Streptosporangiaceae bacterium]|jgi:hypothetical protein